MKLEVDETCWPWRLLSPARLKIEISEAWVRLERSIDVTLLWGIN
jgi:hypothetical protein